MTDSERNKKFLDDFIKRLNEKFINEIEPNETVDEFLNRNVEWIWDELGYGQMFSEGYEIITEIEQV